MVQLKAQHEAQMQALEARLRAAEAALSARSTPPVEVDQQAASVAPAAAAGAANAFNPQISLILSGIATRTSQDPAHWAITGVPMPAGVEAGPGSRGFSLAETELGLSASIPVRSASTT